MKTYTDIRYYTHNDLRWMVNTIPPSVCGCVYWDDTFVQEAYYKCTLCLGYGYMPIPCKDLGF